MATRTARSHSPGCASGSSDRSDGGDRRANYQIGCVILTNLFFFDEADWIPVPSDFSKNIVRYKGYRTDDPVGGRVWEQVQMRLQAATLTLGESEEQPSLYSEPYYPLEGNRIWTPQEAARRPSQEFLEWHRETVFQE